VVLVLVVAVAGVAFAMRGGGDDKTTTANPARTTTTSTPPAPSPSATTSAPSSPAAASSTASAPASKKATKRPPTLHLQLIGTSYVQVKVGGRIILQKVLTKGQSRTFDQKVVSVTLGNAAAVRATVNGKARKPGRRGMVAIFVARR
jgi:hypothetical protein